MSPSSLEYITLLTFKNWILSCTFLPFRDCLNKIYTFTILSRKLSHKGYEKPEIGTGNFIAHFLTWQVTFTMANTLFTFHVFVLYVVIYIYINFWKSSQRMNLRDVGSETSVKITDDHVTIWFETLMNFWL
jgi:hypothetical protein